MTFSWADVKDEIERLYMKEGKSLDEVRDILKEKRNFKPSIRAYKDKLEGWGYRKYNRRRNGGEAPAPDLVRDFAVVQSAETASALLARSDPEHVKVKLKQVGHVLERQAADVTNHRIILGKLCRKRHRQDLEQDDGEESNALKKVARLEDTITQMRKSLETVMAAVALQRSAPTGFASCWKQEPMTLEDAHGKLLPLPLELVVSWEMFDNILLTHFRTLAGVKKVQKGEFEIEDSMTRSTLTRTSPWSQICHPGRKIDMSMIFKDFGKTSVVCPKCDTISREKKGVQVECSNPDCKMIFRTEDDEDAIEASTRRDRRPTPSGQELSTGLVEHLHCSEIEDRPGMFKRVIIRLLKEREGGYFNFGSWQSSYPYDHITEQDKLSYLVSLARSTEYEQCDQNIFLNGNTDLDSASILSPHLTDLSGVMYPGVSDLGLAMFIDESLIPPLVTGFDNDFGGNIDGYRLSGASSYLDFPHSPDEALVHFDQYTFPSVFGNNVYFDGPQNTPELQVSPLQERQTPILFSNYPPPSDIEVFAPQALTVFPSVLLPPFDSNNASSQNPENNSAAEYDESSTPPPAPSKPFRSPPPPMDIASRRKLHAGRRFSTN